jgi:predicted DNA-binding transcriptional regulator YafY
MPPRTVPPRLGRRRGEFSRAPLERMMRVHQRILDGKFPNCRKLARELEVSSKTVMRDIDFMRDRLGLPIEYDQLHFGFFYTEPVTHFPSVEVSEGEVVALLVARKALEQYRGSPYEKPLRTAFDKICKGLQDRIDFRWEVVDGSISFKGIGVGKSDLDLFEDLSRAVLRSHEVMFEYRKLAGSGWETRRVQPFHLGCIENQWYLFGHDLIRNQIRTFALPRMRKLKVSGTRFKRPADFSIATHLGGSFGVFTGREKHRVRIEFDPWASRLVAERSWHGSQRIRQLSGERIELTLHLDGIEEIERWLLSWGVHARVLEPPALVRRLRAATREMAGLYDNVSAP